MDGGEDTMLYGGGQNRIPLDQLFATRPAESIIKVRTDLTVKPQLINLKKKYYKAPQQ